MLGKILVPLDGSEFSELALPYCEELAGRLYSEVHLAYACNPADVGRRHVYETYLQSLSQLIVSSVKAHTTEGIDLTIRKVVLVGNPGAETINYAKRNDINLLVMAAHQRSGLIPWIADRNASRAIQQLHIPVLLVRGKPAASGEIQSKLFNRILIPLDGSEAGEAVVLYVKELAQQISMEVFLLQVISSQQHVRTIGGLNYVKFPEQLVEKKKLEASVYLEKVRTQLDTAGTAVRCVIKFGNVAQEIEKFSHENDIRLVAMSSHDHSWIDRWMLDSVSYQVQHYGKTPTTFSKIPYDVKSNSI